MSDLFDHAKGFFDRIDKIRAGLRKRFNAVHHISFPCRFQAGLKGFTGPFPCLPEGPWVLDLPLMTGAMDEDFSSDIRTEVNECLDIFLGFDPDDIRRDD